MDYILWLVRWVVRHETLVCNLFWVFLGVVCVLSFVIVAIG